MEIQGKHGIYEVRYSEYGYTFTQVKVYQNTKLCKRLPFIFSKNVHNKISTTSPERAETFTADGMESWFKDAVNEYEAILDAKPGFDKKKWNPIRTVGDYVIGTLIIAAIVFIAWIVVTREESVTPAAPIVISEQIERYVLVEMNPPKHFYVTLKRISDGSITERSYVSKHCNSWRDNKIGDEFNILVKTWKYDNGATTRTLEDLNGVFCK